MFVVEVKGDEESSDPAADNVKKHEYATEHFKRLNDWLEKEKIPTRYQFNMISPKSYNVFFQKLRDGGWWVFGQSSTWRWRAPATGEDEECEQAYRGQGCFYVFYGTTNLRLFAAAIDLLRTAHGLVLMLFQNKISTTRAAAL